MALLETEPRSATVFTLEKSVFLRLERDRFFGLLGQHPSIALKILKHLSSRLRQANEQIRSLAMFDIYGRIARCLLNLGQTQGKRLGNRIVIPDRPSFQDLAHMVGCSRETLSRALKVLQQNGYLTINKKEIVMNRTW
jgi:CRP-like cAMP-binding protein